MTIGISLFLIAVGAILKFAVHVHVEGFDYHVAGVILMVIGILGVILGLWLATLQRTEPSSPPPRPL